MTQLTAATRAPTEAVTRSTLAALAAAVGDGNVLTGEDIEAKHRGDLTGKFKALPAFVVRPASTEQVSAVVKIAAAAGLPITPFGGGTGLVGGGVATPGGVVLSLERMNRIVEIDRTGLTMTVEAGAILQVVQEAAEAEGMLMPLDLGGRGSATIGGNIATNAGGMRVLRWGMMRDMVLGLEVVLADGTIVSALTKALKDNAGYHWKQLFIGAEGTLGVVTKAVLRLRPAPTTSQTAIVALAGFEAATTFLRDTQAKLSGRLSTFELMWPEFYELLTTAQAARRPRPLPCGAPLYALIEALGADERRDPEVFEEILAQAMEAGIVLDAVVAASARQRQDLIAVRDELGEAFAPLRPIIVFDVSMALSDMPAFIAKADASIRAEHPDAVILHYGHAGDGNLHLVVSVGESSRAIEHQVQTAVFTAVRAVGGSISAEHGVGLERMEFIGWTRTPEELALMRAFKTALDPRNLMNPGKVLPAVLT
jgi:FAD/FMN-containing dehydrogenase